jgi:23S rRNA (uracil1939-C5)-methyltransferase
MAQFFKAKKQSARRGKRNTQEAAHEQIQIAVDVIDHHGNGICLSHKPIVVIPAAIPDEIYKVQVLSKKQKAWHGKIVKVLQAHDSARVEPFCPYVSQCGGCSHQAYRADYLIEEKQASLAKYLNISIPSSRLKNAVWEDIVRSGISDNRTSDSKLDSADNGSSSLNNKFGYRRRARIAIDARNENDIKVGFRQEKSNKVVDIPTCAVLAESLQNVYEQVVSLVKRLPSASSIGHITLTEGAQGAQVCFHLMNILDDASVIMLNAEQKATGIQCMIETKAGKLINVAALNSSDQNREELANLKFTISDAPSLELSVTASNFIQINQHVNQQMLKLALNWLSPSKDDLIVDLFCGIGNFSLFLAPHCKELVGVEGVADMVQQANENALLNGIQNCRFEHYDLNDLSSLASLNIPEGALFVVDPSRAGALEIMKVMATFKPKKILYVSCNPTSFARDVDVLPNKYEIEKMRALDMFPFTKHIEMMALISSR